jgi:hypothetical protein
MENQASSTLKVHLRVNRLWIICLIGAPCEKNYKKPVFRDTLGSAYGDVFFVIFRVKMVGL